MAVKPPLLVKGMHGMGDNIHQRAVLRQLMEAHDVFLETSWVSIYHDLIAQGLHVIRRLSRLRTQSKNQEREAHLFEKHSTQGMPAITMRYVGQEIVRSGTVLGAMCACARVDYERADFRLPVPEAWCTEADRLITEWGVPDDKPLMIYRPLTSRPEWNGGQLRNADPEAYAALLATIRDRFFVVSIADLAPGQEWLVGPRFKADVIIEDGRLPFETLAALVEAADLMFTSGGFGAVLAPAVGTPVISVYGGYERASWIGDTCSKLVPYLGIEPIKPCDCASSGCRTFGRGCNKSVDISAAIARVKAFVTDLGISLSSEHRPWGEYHEAIIPQTNRPPPVMAPLGGLSRAQQRQQREIMLQQMGLKA